MATQPCDLCGKRVFGPNSHIYPAVLDGVTTRRSKNLLCRQHTAQIQEALDGMLLTEAEGEYFQLNIDGHKCSSCGDEVDGERTHVFVTFYPVGKGRHEYYSVAHRACQGPSWVEELWASTPLDRRRGP